jgi:ABC-type sugar transport system permease subunit
MIEVILFILIPLALLIGGIYSLVKYKKTKQRKFLIIGLILTMIVVGFIILVVLAFLRSQSVMTYMAGPDF